MRSRRKRAPAARSAGVERDKPAGKLRIPEQSAFADAIEELDRAIQILLDQLVERHARKVPEPARQNLRWLLRGQLANDPTLLEMIDDVRRSTKR